MAVKPQPWVYECGQCGWRKIIALKGDCIMDSSIEICPNCASHDIGRVELTMPEFMIEKLVHFMSGRN